MAPVEVVPNSPPFSAAGVSAKARGSTGRGRQPTPWRASPPGYCFFLALILRLLAAFCSLAAITAHLWHRFASGPAL